jgi:hypothetical protein
MAYAAVRKKRRHPAIIKTDPLFAKAMEEGDYEKAAAIVFWAALKVGGYQRIMSALYDGNSFYRRKDKRRGL